jgi:hypothetical protein
MKKGSPLYKSNPELFKIYLLDNTVFVKGLTEEDEILALEIQIRVIIRFFVLESSIYNNCTKNAVLSDLRKTTKKKLSIQILQFNKPSILLNKTLPLYKSNVLLFNQYVLQAFSSRPNMGKIKGVTTQDRKLKVKITLDVLFKEIAILSARIQNKKVHDVEATLNQKVEEILSDYKHFLTVENKN